MSDTFVSMVFKKERKIAGKTNICYSTLYITISK